jgi:hypothetical protein
MGFKCDTCDRVLKSSSGKFNHMRGCGISILNRNRRKRRKTVCDSTINDVKSSSGISTLNRNRRKTVCDSTINDVKSSSGISTLNRNRRKTVCDSTINDVKCILCYNIIKKDDGGFRAYTPCIGGITENLYKCKHCMKDDVYNDSNERMFWRMHRNGIYMNGGDITLSPCPNVWCWFGY